MERTSASHSFKIECSKVFDLLPETSWKILKEALLKEAEKDSGLVLSEYSDTYEINGFFEFLVEEKV